MVAFRVRAVSMHVPAGVRKVTKFVMLMSLIFVCRIDSFEPLLNVTSLQDRLTQPKLIAELGAGIDGIR